MSCHQYKPRGTAFYVLQRHLPSGYAWLGFRTVGKNSYKLLKAFSEIFEAMWVALCNVVKELNPYSTQQLIEEWEKALSLPDKCLPRPLTIEERRAQVIFKLKRKRYTTSQDWIDLAWEVFGLKIRITPGWEYQKPCLYDAEYPVRYDLFPKLGRFRVYIDVLNINFKGYPYDYPIEYGDNNPNLGKLQCFLDRIRPANSIIIWNEFPEISNDDSLNVFTSEFSEDYS